MTELSPFFSSLALLTGILVVLISMCAAPLLLLWKSVTIGQKVPADELLTNDDFPSDPWEPITPEKRFELYIASTKQIEDFAQRNSDSFEKAMITLSGGGLGLSMTFLGLVKGQQVLVLGEFLPASWIFFGLSLGLMIWSYQVSRDAYDQQLTVLDKHYFEFSEEQNRLKRLPGQIASIAV